MATEYTTAIPIANVTQSVSAEYYHRHNQSGINIQTLAADDGTGIVEMLFCTSLVALVGAGEQPNFSPRHLQIINTKVYKLISDHCIKRKAKSLNGTYVETVDNMRVDISYLDSCCENEPPSTYCRIGGADIRIRYQ